MAHRLSARSANKVLLCEAGQDTPPGNEPPEIRVFFHAEDCIRDCKVTGVQTCALPISSTWKRWSKSQALRGLVAVPRTIATINNTRNAWLFDQRFHVDVAVNQAEILASLIEQEMSLGEMMTLLKLRRGRYSLVEDKIQPGSSAVGVALRDLPLPP